MSNYRSTIYVQSRSGYKPKNKRVVLSIDGVFSGGMTNAVYTDDQGRAIVVHASKGDATIYVEGTTVGRMRVPGETVVYI